MKGKKLTIENLNRIFANPFYCINISEDMCGEHEPLITEEMFIQVAERVIKDKGVRFYMENLLANLKGDFV